MKIILDIVLLFLFGAMCNTAVTGTQFHEVGGIVYAALIMVHLMLNRNWIVAGFKGKLHGKRAVLLAAVNLGLFLDLLIILATGIRASHFLFPAAVKAPEYFMAVHAVGGVAAAGLVFTHVLLHVKSITKRHLPRKLAFAVILITITGYSLFGTVQGALKWTQDKSNMPGNEQHSRTNGEDVHKPKDGEKKQTQENTAKYEQRTKQSNRGGSSHE